MGNKYKFFRLFLTAFCFLTAALCYEIAHADITNPKNGIYLGLAPMPDLGDADERWFHEIKLTIQDSEVTLDASPIFYKNGKRWASASDGGFWTYQGKIVQTKGAFVLRLKLLSSDYANITNKEPQWPLTLNLDGTITIEGVIYKAKS